MKKILSIIMCAMLVFALPCLAVAQTAGAATSATTLAAER